jgi:hypothetical protein
MIIKPLGGAGDLRSKAFMIRPYHIFDDKLTGNGGLIDGTNYYRQSSSIISATGHCGTLIAPYQVKAVR